MVALALEHPAYKCNRSEALLMLEGRRAITSAVGGSHPTDANGAVFSKLQRTQVLTEECRRHYSWVRPHSALGCRPPAPETLLVSTLSTCAGVGA